jgi:hypothetical protein
MALTITDTLISSDRTAHLACAYIPGRPDEGWQVSWLPGAVVGQRTAITAMTLADLVSEGGVITLTSRDDAQHRPWAPLAGHDPEHWPPGPAATA